LDNDISVKRPISSVIWSARGGKERRFAATTVTANVWMGGGVAGGVISVILALIPVTLVYYLWATGYSIGSNIGFTILTVVLTAIIGGIIASISDNPSIFIFICFVIPAIPGMIIMYKTEDADWEYGGK